ncbi:NrfD/PsrC family molybdoenzyme membrane anchor subunit [Anaeromyxobacter oryzae]|uniref:Ni/Fe-hydrogenase cytochrome b subunit n=1 Tax=Anaeromyxobacter oryzae TaxID=2918170 RepID=A0ABN6MUN3_9BACT|nr:Ni/Fe-hydrogenase cytochrome b subunit [Anaeromyxobacter oryzae]BDG03178.1 Ni/Fe-hydrogenase cytochrome b subunit [Anaeromyxobacter oryzae]
MTQTSERPLGGTMLTRGGKFVLFLAALGFAFVAVRLVTGLGAVTALNDGYPWGLWKPLNVVTFTGVGAGALGLALVTYVANRGRHHPLVRSAVLTGAIAYTLAGFSVLVDLGRWWTVWALFVPPWWNLSSVLLEVALCVMAYCAVLWIEVVPALLERWQARPAGALRRIADRALPFFRAAFPFVVALAIVLPFMHQSSLGSLFLATPTKLHPLWYSGWLPALFLDSCLVMGFGAVIVVDTLTHLAYRRTRDTRLLATLSVVLAALALVFVALRLADVAASGAIVSVRGWRGVLFLVEMGLFAYPAIRLLGRRYREDEGRLFWAAELAVLGGALYRFDTYLAAFTPGAGWTYFPSVGELLFSVGLGAAGVAMYVAVARALPILSGVRGAPITAPPPGSAVRVSA